MKMPDIDVVTADRLKAEELRLRYLELIDKPDVYPTRANWAYITEHAMLGLGPALYRKYLGSLSIPEIDRMELHDVAIESFPAYLRAVPHHYAVETVYGDFSTDASAAVALVHDCLLFDARRILEMLCSGMSDEALALIDAYSPEYTADDLADMCELAEYLDSLPLLGSVERRRGLLGSSTKYVCPRGHVNDASHTHCTHSGCGLDIFGHTAAQVARIGVFRHRLRALESLFGCKYGDGPDGM